MANRRDRDRQQRIAAFYRNKAAGKAATEMTAAQFDIKLPKPKPGKFEKEGRRWRGK